MQSCELTQDHERIPDEIKELDRWVCWRWEESYKKDGTPDNPTKVPVNPLTGGRAMSNNPATWGTYQDAVNAAIHGRIKDVDVQGIGFMFNGDGIIGVDLDHCKDENGDLTPEARDIISILDSYTEYSQSGNGIHIICYGKMPEGRKKKSNVEMYAIGRFFIMTGNVIDDAHTVVEKRFNELLVIHSRYLNDKKEKKKAAAAVQQLDLDDKTLIEKAMAAENGSRFKALYDGDTSGNGKDDSAADLAFCNLLAFWTQCNAGQMDRIFRQSGLMREKWDERHGADTYGNITIQKAIADCSKVYEPRQKKAKANTQEVPEVDNGLDALVENTDKSKNPGIDKQLPWFFIEKDKIRFIPLVLAEHLADERNDFFVGDYFYEWLPFSTDGKKYEGGFYKKNNKSRASLIVQNYMIKHKTTITDRNIKEVLNRWNERRQRDPLRGELNINKNLINVKNGMYDTNLDKLIAHDPKYYSTIQLNFCYDLKAKQKTIEKWLNDMQWEENIDCLWEQIGYAITFDCSQKKLFVHYSPSKGNSGKSTFLRIIANLIGAEYTSSIGWAKLDDRFSLSQLFNKLVNIDGDIPTKPISSDASKKLTGMDNVYVEEKGKQGFSAQLFTKLFFAANELPRQSDSSEANFMRILVTTWDKKYLTSEEIDPDIENKIAADFDYVGTKALHEGLQRLRENGAFTISKLQEKANKDYSQANDTVLQFIDEECIKAPNYCIKRSEFYIAYERYAMHPQSRQKFFDKIERLGFFTKDITRGYLKGRYIIGITLSSNVTYLPMDKRIEKEQESVSGDENVIKFPWTV